MNHKTPRIRIPKSVQAFVFARDNYTCQSCQEMQDKVKLSIDHIIPLSHGGSNDISNLQTLCLFCNQSKNNRLDRRFKRYFNSDK